MEKKQLLIRRGDGRSWDGLGPVRLELTGWLPACPVEAWARACHDGKTLYLLLEAAEAPIRATLTGKLEQVCEDSCLEFFFAPVAGDERYFNFEWNPLGTLYLGFGGKREQRVRQIVKDPQTLFAPRPFQREGGWGISFRIPAEFISRYFPGYTFSSPGEGNFYKCGDQTECPHYLAWSPLDCEKPDYHRREDFGILRFEGAEG